MIQKALPRHSLESCTLQLNNWKPFLSSSEFANSNITPEAAAATSDSSSKQRPVDLNGLMEILDTKSDNRVHRSTCTTKKQCLSDRGSRKNSFDFLDMTKLSLLEEDNKKPLNKAFRREAGVEKTSCFDKVHPRSIPPISSSHMARKRRRRGSCSGSGRSSDKSRNRMYGSDPPTIGPSATYATCSDFPIAGTDSSGELFFYGDGNWGSDMIISMNEVKNPPGAVKREDQMELVGKSALLEQKMHHRFRRRRQDWKMMEYHGGRHSWVPQNN